MQMVADGHKFGLRESGPAVWQAAESPSLLNHCGLFEPWPSGSVPKLGRQVRGMLK